VSRIFPHYPSKVLTDETVLGLGPMGSAFATKAYHPVQYMELTVLLKEDLLYALAQHVSHKDVRVEELTRWAGSQWGMDRASTALHVDWLIKHGVVLPKKTLMPLRPPADR